MKIRAVARVALTILSLCLIADAQQTESPAYVVNDEGIAKYSAPTADTNAVWSAAIKTLMFMKGQIGTADKSSGLIKASRSADPGPYYFAVTILIDLFDKSTVVVVQWESPEVFQPRADPKENEAMAQIRKSMVEKHKEWDRQNRDKFFEEFFSRLAETLK